MNLSPPHLRTFPVRKHESQGGTLEGIAAAYGQLDSYNTVFAPGCFGTALGQFLHEGVLLTQHDSSSCAVGYPIEGRETADGLVLSFAFHETPRAQEYRNICLERLQAGLKVGLSIGFDIDLAETFPTGAALLRAVQGEISRYDVGTLSKARQPVSLIRRVARLYECSIVNFASIPRSEVTEIRAVTKPSSSIWTRLSHLNTELRHLIHLCKPDNNSHRSG